MGKTKLPGREDLKEFLKLFAGESDRAVVVLGGAYLDSCLEEMLRTWLADDVDGHFEPPNGLLSSYGAKYQLAHALGALDEPHRADFKHVGAIRNHFAHHVVDATWSHPIVRKHLRPLRARFDILGPFGERDLFLFTVAALASHLRYCEKERIVQTKAEAMVKAMRAARKLAT